MTETKISQQLDSIATEINQFKADAKSDLRNMQTQLDAIDLANSKKLIGWSDDRLDLTKELTENESVARLLHDRKGRAVIKFEGKSAASLFERKSTVTSSALGYSTSGVLGIDRIPGITAEARQVLKIRDLLTSRPTTMQIVDFVKVNTPLSLASPQVEASNKFENAVTFTSASERVRTIATVLPASKQAIDDMDELRGFIERSLPYYVNLTVENQLLTGDGTGENLHGLIPQASAFSTALLSASAGWNKIDIVGRAIQQIEEAKEIDPSFVIVNPRDWWGMRLTKNTQGNYILGDPQSTVRASIFDRPVVVTTGIAAGTFLVGSGDPAAAEIRNREETTVEMSTEHQDFFVKNLVMFRAETRLCLVVKRPASFVYGSFTTSPA